MNIWAWTKNAFDYAKRIAAIESRVRALEKSLERHPADACPKCGERALRLSRAGGVIKGGGPNHWREDVWQCEKCAHHEKRVVYFKN